MSIKAYLDSYDKIRIEVQKYFYGGECTEFYLEEDDKNLKEFKIINKFYEEKKVIYDVEAMDHIVMGKSYAIFDNHGYRCKLIYRYITRTEQFDKEFYYDGNDLGANYTKEKTTFKLWAPTSPNAYIRLYDNHELIQMKKGKCGVFECTVEDDLRLVAYNYHILVNNKWHDAIDPYALASLPNQGGSVIMDILEITSKKSAKKDIKPENAIIYEASVRDFTSKLKKCHRSTFRGFVSENLKTTAHRVAGFDYLKSLGITHVQLMPVFDFYTVDDYDKFVFYNWGYDPIQFNALKPSFSTNPSNPLSTVLEFKSMIDIIHSCDMLVTMDVVYNHMYDRDLSSFESIVPYYYFRMNKDGVYSNGSFCGNDFDSTRAMGRKYIVDSVCKWAVLYDIDGFRFDLMGIIDVVTMNQIVNKLHKLSPNMLVYGEGWDMPTFLDDIDKASMYQAYQMPSIAFFNDTFRDTIKGKTGENEGQVQGYASGNNMLVNDVMKVLKGNSLNCQFVSPLQSINYCECHDNATVMDKLMMCVGGENYYTHKKRAKLMLGMVLTAQGMPFINLGQEFGRGKNMMHNTYNTSDEINGIDWDLKDKNIDMVEYLKTFIKIRKQFNCFHYKTVEEVNKNIYFEVIGDNILRYRLFENSEEYSYVEIYYNPNNSFYAMDLPSTHDIIYSESSKSGIEALSILVTAIKRR